jgi:hypothetical protein
VPIKDAQNANTKDIEVVKNPKSILNNESSRNSPQLAVPVKSDNKVSF